MRLGKRVFSLPKPFFEEHSSQINSLITLSTHFAKDLFSQEPPAFIKRNKIQANLVQQILARGEQIEVGNALDAVTGLGIEQAMKVLQSAALIIMVNEVQVKLNFKSRLIDLVMSSHGYTSVEVSQKEIIFSRRMKENIVIQNDRSLQIQDVDGFPTLVTELNPSLTPKGDWLKTLDASIDDYLDNKLSYASYIKTLESVAAIVRSTNPDYRYNRLDELGVLPTAVIKPNLIYRSLLNVMRDTLVDFVCVTGHSKLGKEFYSRIADQMALEGHRVEFVFVTNFHDMRIFDQEDTDSMLLQCPFTNMYGSKFVTPSSGDLFTRADRYSKTIKNNFLKGMYKDVVGYFRYTCALYETPVVPIENLGGEYLLSSKTDEFGCYFVTPHRLRNLHVVSTEMDAFDRADLSIEKDDVNSILTAKLLASYHRIFLSTGQPAEMAARMNDFKITKRLYNQELEKFTYGKFFPIMSTSNHVQKDVSSSTILTMLFRKAARSKMKYRFTYDDFPEEYMHRREDVVEYGVSVGLIKVDVINNDKNVYELMLPMTPYKEVYSPIKGLKADQIPFIPHDEIHVSNSGMVLGNLSRVNPSIVEVESHGRIWNKRSTSYRKSSPKVSLFKGIYRAIKREYYAEVLSKPKSMFLPMKDSIDDVLAILREFVCGHQELQAMLVQKGYSNDGVALGTIIEELLELDIIQETSLGVKTYVCF